MKDNLFNALIIIVLCLLVYLAFIKPDGSDKYSEILLEQSNKLQSEIDSNKTLIIALHDSIALMDRKETTIKNYYNEIISAVDTVSDDSTAIRIIRKQLENLGAARIR